MRSTTLSPPCTGCSAGGKRNQPIPTRSGTNRGHVSELLRRCGVRGIDIPAWGPVTLTNMPSVEGSDDETRPDPKSARVAVIDRSGHLLFETHGTMADWMPAWP